MWLCDTIETLSGAPIVPLCQVLHCILPTCLTRIATFFRQSRSRSLASRQPLAQAFADILAPPRSVLASSDSDVGNVLSRVQEDEEDHCYDNWQCIQKVEIDLVIFQYIGCTKRVLNKSIDRSDEDEERCENDSGQKGRPIGVLWQTRSGRIILVRLVAANANTVKDVDEAHGGYYEPAEGEELDGESDEDDVLASIELRRFGLQSMVREYERRSIVGLTAVETIPPPIPCTKIVTMSKDTKIGVIKRAGSHKLLKCCPSCGTTQSTMRPNAM